jgi:hypothetical protein
VVGQIAAEQRGGALICVYEHGARTSCAHQHIAPVRCEGGGGTSLCAPKHQTKPMPRSPPHSAAASSAGDPVTGSVTVTSHGCHARRSSKSKSRASAPGNLLCVPSKTPVPCSSTVDEPTSRRHIMWPGWQLRMQRISCLVTRHAAHAASTPQNETAAHTQYHHTSTDKHFWDQTEAWWTHVGRLS